MELGSERLIVKQAMAIFPHRARRAKDRNDATVRITRDVRSVSREKGRWLDNKRDDTRGAERRDESRDASAVYVCLHIHIYTCYTFVNHSVL